MGNKKKYLGGLKVLLLLLFGILFVTYSTCYASEPSYNDFDIPLEFWLTLINYTKQNGYQDNYFTDEKVLLVSNTLYNYYNNTAKSLLKNMVNTYNSNADERNLIVFIVYDNYSTSDFKIWFLISNNTLNNIPNRYSISINSDNTIRCLLSRPALKLTYTKSNNQIQYGGYLSGTTNNQEALTNYNSWFYNSNNIDVSTSTINNTPFFGVNSAPLNTIPLNNTQYHLNGYYDINYIYVPEEPSGDVTPSGDTGGYIDYTNNLNNINNSINTQGQNIVNQISGDTQKVIDNQNQNTQTIVNAISGETEKITNTLTDSADDLIDNTTITSGDIVSSLNFEIAQDPYSNFWFTLTNNLKSALLGTKRSIDISFQGRTWTISLDEYMVLPTWLIIILTPFSTAFFTWVLVRQFKLIFDKLASGNIDSLLKENSEERHFKFVLGGE